MLGPVQMLCNCGQGRSIISSLLARCCSSNPSAAIADLQTYTQICMHVALAVESNAFSLGQCRPPYHSSGASSGERLLRAGTAALASVHPDYLHRTSQHYNLFSLKPLEAGRVRTPFSHDAHRHEGVHHTSRAFT